LFRKCVQFKRFPPISQYRNDVRIATTIFSLSGSSPKPDKIVGQIESGLSEVYCNFLHLCCCVVVYILLTCGKTAEMLQLKLHCLTHFRR